MRFGLTTFLIAIALSLLALLWLELPWWSIFRRCVSIGAALSLWIWIRKVERRSFSSYGLGDPGAGKRQLLFGLSLGACTLAVMLGLGLAGGLSHMDITPDRTKLWRTVLGFVPAAALISVLEELVFRGYILQQLRPCSASAAVIASSALYAIVHLNTTTPTPSAWLELGGLFLLGGVLALSYLRTGQLYLAMGLHAVLAYGARVNKLLISFPDISISWLTGTSRLVNGVLGWAALLGMGAIMVVWTKRR